MMDANPPYEVLPGRWPQPNGHDGPDARTELDPTAVAELVTAPADAVIALLITLELPPETTAADAFANEINEQLVTKGLPARLETKHGKFPTTCSQCGGALPFTYSEVNLTCPFCSSVIHAES